MTNYNLESEFQRDCNKFLDHLIKQGFPIDYIHLPKMVNAYGKGRMGKNKNRKGKPDLYVILSGGKVIMIELKINNNKLDPEQVEHLDKYEKMGYRTFVINGDIEEFKRIIQENLYRGVE